MQSPENQEQKRPTLLVGISNPATVPRLMTLAGLLAKRAEYEVAVTHIVTVPSQMSLSAMRCCPEAVSADRLLREAIRVAAEHGIKARGVVEIARHIHEGLASAVKSQQADLLLVGYSDDIPGQDESERAFDKIMHRVARGTRSDLIVAKFRRETINSVLVPVAGDPNLRLTGLLASAINAGTGAAIRFIHVVEPGANPDDEELAFASLLAAHDLKGVGEFEIIRTARPTAAIMEQADKHDLVIIGAAKRPSITDAIFGGMAERIASEVPCSVLLVRAKRARDHDR